MAKKHGKVKVEIEKPKTRQVKDNVRLFKAEDIIWICLGDMIKGLQCCKKVINEDGFWLRFPVRRDDVSEELKVISGSWKSVAEMLGKDMCEYCLNPEGAAYLLVYDIREVEA